MCGCPQEHQQQQHHHHQHHHHQQQQHHHHHQQVRRHACQTQAKPGPVVLVQWSRHHQRHHCHVLHHPGCSHHHHRHHQRRRVHPRLRRHDHCQSRCGAPRSSWTSTPTSMAVPPVWVPLGAWGVCAGPACDRGGHCLAHARRRGGPSYDHDGRQWHHHHARPVSTHAPPSCAWQQRQRTRLACCFVEKPPKPLQGSGESVRRRAGCVRVTQCPSPQACDWMRGGSK